MWRFMTARAELINIVPNLSTVLKLIDTTSALALSYYQRVDPADNSSAQSVIEHPIRQWISRQAGVQMGQCCILVVSSLNPSLTMQDISFISDKHRQDLQIHLLNFSIYVWF